ncbi:oxidoreductase [Roseibium sp.]|uniref:oxidoreductase n=1 Tax=Roseibium sp. TaxID=1936156 RepID=UPI003B529E75
MSDTPKTAVITGAAQGIGEAVALRLADEGFRKFILIDRQADKLTEVSDALKNKGAEAKNLVLDLTDMSALDQEVTRAVQEAGPINLLVNAAGTTARGGLTDTSPETFDFIYNLNVRAPFFMMQKVAPAIVQGGAIVNITSMLAYGGPPFLLGYSSSKAALVALTRGAANTLKRDRVRVFGINLGWTLTPAEQQVQTKVHGLGDDWGDTIGAKQPFGRLLLPSDPAGVIAFLASKDAAMMTGAIIDLDQFVAGTVDDNPGAGA